MSTELLDQNARVDESASYNRKQKSLSILRPENTSEREIQKGESITHLTSCDILKRIYSQCPARIWIKHTNSIQANLQKDNKHQMIGVLLSNTNNNYLLKVLSFLTTSIVSNKKSYNRKNDNNKYYQGKSTEDSPSICYSVRNSNKFLFTIFQRELLNTRKCVNPIP